jgi:hypothetical protein
MVALFELIRRWRKDERHSRLSSKQDIPKFIGLRNLKKHQIDAISTQSRF